MVTCNKVTGKWKDAGMVFLLIFFSEFFSLHSFNCDLFSLILFHSGVVSVIPVDYVKKVISFLFHSVTVNSVFLPLRHLRSSICVRDNLINIEPKSVLALRVTCDTYNAISNIINIYNASGATINISEIQYFDYQWSRRTDTK